MSERSDRTEKLKIEKAKLFDLPALLEIENSVFPGDRLSSRSFRRLLRQGNCELVSAVLGGRLAGYGLTLYRKGSQVVRLYSIAISPSYQGRGLSRRLLRNLEGRALRRGCSRIRLTVRPDNPRAIGLYQTEGYREIGTLPSYYEDRTPALSLEKVLRRLPARSRMPHGSPDCRSTRRG